MNIKELFKYYKNNTIIKEGEDYAIVGFPFFHLGHDEGVAFRFSYKDGQLILSDCHSTMDYLDAEGVDLDDYTDKLDAIMKKFDIYLDGNVFRKIIHNYDYLPGLNRQTCEFFEATSVIAHINL